MHTQRIFLLIMAGLTMLAAAGCAGSGAPTPAQSPTQPAPTAIPPATPTEQPARSIDKLIDALRAAGATVERGEPLSQDFLSTPGVIVKVDAADIQVFEYADAASAGADAARVSPDGSIIGNAIVDWIDAPHFYRQDNLIVLYVGSDSSVLDLLTGALGAPFAEGSTGAFPFTPADELTMALTARDWATLQAQMGESFLIGYWRSEGVTYSPQDAVQQLLPDLLVDGGRLTFVTDESQFPSLDGTPLPSMLAPDVKLSQAIYSRGWGSSGMDESILILAERPDGSIYWYGMLYALGGFDRSNREHGGGRNRATLDGRDILKSANLPGNRGAPDEEPPLSCGASFLREKDTPCAASSRSFSRSSRSRSSS